MIIWTEIEAYNGMNQLTEIEAYNGMNQLSVVGTTNHVALAGNHIIYQSLKILKILLPEQ
jgi:hypothetical protein